MNRRESLRERGEFVTDPNPLARTRSLELRLGQAEPSGLIRARSSDSRGSSVFPAARSGFATPGRQAMLVDGKNSTTVSTTSSRAHKARRGGLPDRVRFASMPAMVGKSCSAYQRRIYESGLPCSTCASIER